MTISRVLVLAFGLTACAKPAEPPAEPPAADGGAQPGGESQSLTAAQCEAQGGQVVGDIGDGAIHRPDYRCPDSGEPPLGSIVPAEGEPIATEGAVCC